MPLLYLICCVGIQVWAWRSVAAKVQSGTISRLQGALRYAGWAFLPAVLFLAGFATLIGIEEWLQVALIGERSALLALPVLGLSVLCTVAFVIRSIFFLRR